MIMTILFFSDWQLGVIQYQRLKEIFRSVDDQLLRALRRDIENNNGEGKRQEVTRSFFNFSLFFVLALQIYIN